MLNQLVIIGRLTKMDKIEENQVLITIANKDYLKNKEGEYETNYIDVILTGSIATNTIEYCKNGDLIGIKGRVKNIDGKNEIITEKITFLSSQSEKINNKINGDD